MTETPNSDTHGRAAAGRRRADSPRRRARLPAPVTPALWFAALALCVSWGMRAGTGGPGAAQASAGAVSAGTSAGAVFVRASAVPQGRDYSRFTHTNPEHARLPCLLCHRRADNSPRPLLPGHQPCAGCHAQQFSESGGPLCTICHTGAGDAQVKRFPPLRSFDVAFDHARHAAGGARPSAGCASCHSPRRGGAALSIPAGLSAHTACYQCHTPRAQAGGRDISSCATCHRVGRFRRTPETARAFRVGFSHAEHRKGLGCADCHTVRAGAAQGRQVTSPQPLMHHASPRARSCMTCHNNRRVFGGDDFGDCTRCHKGAAWGA